MTPFRTPFSMSVLSKSEELQIATPGSHLGVFDGNDAQTINDAACAIFISLYVSYFAATHISDDFSLLDKTDKTWYRGKLKSSIINFVSGIKSHDLKICKTIYKLFPLNFSNGFADLCDSVDDQITPMYEAVKAEIYNIFNNEHSIPNAKNLSIIYSMSLLADLAQGTLEDLVRCVPALQGNVSRLDLTKICERGDKMCHLASETAPEYIHIDLNKQLTLRSKIGKFKKAVRDADVFQKAFVAGGFTLS